MAFMNSSFPPFYRDINEKMSKFGEGICSYDPTVLSEYQLECIKRLSLSYQLENDIYLRNHPEVVGVLKLIFNKNVKPSRNLESLRETALMLVKPVEEINAEIAKFLKCTAANTKGNRYNADLEEDLRSVTIKRDEIKGFNSTSPSGSTPATLSSSFISIRTSTITLPTPEPISTPEVSTSEEFYDMVSTHIDKAIYSQVNDDVLKYDTAYVELMKAVENAMEVPVIPIRKDILDILNSAYLVFSMYLDEKADKAAQIAWQNRMRKKVKKTLRKQINFRGYVTQPSSKNESSSHESCKKPLLRSSECHQHLLFNRYPKDSFGVYLPTNEYNNNNLTIYPSSLEKFVQEENPTDTISMKSADSFKSGTSIKYTGTNTGVTLKSMRIYSKQ